MPVIVRFIDQELRTALWDNVVIRVSFAVSKIKAVVKGKIPREKRNEGNRRELPERILREEKAPQRGSTFQQSRGLCWEGMLSAYSNGKDPGEANFL